MRSRERSRFSIQDGGDKETPSLQADTLRRDHRRPRPHRQFSVMRRRRETGYSHAKAWLIAAAAEALAGLRRSDLTIAQHAPQWDLIRADGLN